MDADVEYRESQEETQAKDCRYHRKLLHTIDNRILKVTFNCQRNNSISFLQVSVAGASYPLQHAHSCLASSRAFKGLGTQLGLTTLVLVGVTY